MLATRLVGSAAHRRQRSFLRMAGERLSNDLLVERARWLPEEERAFFLAYVTRGMTLEELGAISHMSERRARRRVEVIRRKLEDRWFGLTMRYGARLTAAARELAVGRWIEGRALRTMAAERGISLHYLRQQLTLIQSQMLYMAGHEGEREAEEE
ncbi:MAG: hypothetical protein ACTHN5_08040 [Phycisphaerae bacterium]